MKSVRLLGLAASLSLVACGGGGGDAGAGGAGGAAAGPPVNGGTAIVAVKADFGGLNPVTNSALVTDEVLRYMLFTPLVKFDDKLQVQPYLAESWELSDTAVTFKLRNDVKWHDGQPVTAEDVKFTFDLAKNPEAAAGIVATYLGGVKSATVVDPHTIRFSFVSPHAQPLEDFWWAPVPKHLLQGVDPSQLTQAPFNQKPVGSGPFKVVSWQQGQALTLAANPAFPAALGGRPKLDQVVFRVIPEATTRLTELTTGAVDVNYSILPDEAKQIADQKQRLRVEHYPSREMTFIGWNNEREPFKDPRVRKALSASIDRGRIIEGLMAGYAKPAGAPIPMLSESAPQVEPVPFDPAAAARLFAEAGWRDTNGDKILDKNGKPLHFTLLTNASNKLFQDIAQVVQNQLKAVGVSAEIRTLEFQTMLQQHKARDYDAIISNWTWDYFRPDPTPLFTCAEARKEKSANRAGYCNPAVDAIVGRGLKENDPAAAKQVWAEFAQSFQQDQPITLLYWTEEIAGVGPRVQNVKMDPRGKLVDIAQWWIPERMQRR